MDFIVPIVIIIVSCFFTDYIYTKTDITKFMRFKLCINTKWKCNVLDLFFFGIAISLFPTTSTGYGRLIKCAVFFIALLISGLIQHTKREIKHYTAAENSNS